MALVSTPNIMIEICIKILLAIFGGYAFTSGYIALSSILFVSFGMQVGEAVVLHTMIGILVYLGVILWVFSTSHIWRTSLIISMMAAGMLISSSYLAAH
jgi:hypothetical protein